MILLVVKCYVLYTHLASMSEDRIADTMLYDCLIPILIETYLAPQAFTLGWLSWVQWDSLLSLLSCLVHYLCSTMDFFNLYSGSGSKELG